MDNENTFRQLNKNKILEELCKTPLNYNLIKSILLNKISRFSPPKIDQNDVIFNTIELLAKRLDSFNDQRHPLTKETNTKKKKKNFLQSSIELEKQQIESMVQKAMETRVENNPGNIELQIASRLSNSKYAPAHSKELLEKALLKGLEKSSVPLLLHIYSAFVRDKEEYKEISLRMVNAVVRYSEGEKGKKIDELLSKLPRVEKEIYDCLFMEVPKNTGSLKGVISVLEKFVLFRKSERENALFILLHFSTHIKLGVRVKAIQAIMRIIDKDDRIMKTAISYALNHLKKALELNSEGIQPKELNEDYIPLKLKEAERIFNKRKTTDETLKKMTGEKLEEAKTAYIESVKKTTLLLRQKAEESFGHRREELSGQHVSAECQFYFSLSFKYPPLLKNVAEMYTQTKGEFKHHVLKNAIAVMFEFAGDSERSQFLYEKMVCSDSETLHKNAAELFLCYVAISAIVSVAVSKSRAWDITETVRKLFILTNDESETGKTGEETDLKDGKTDQKKENETDLIKDIRDCFPEETVNVKRLIEKSIEIAENSGEERMKGLILTSIFPLIAEEKRDGIFGTIFEICSIEELSGFLDYCLWERDEMEIPDLKAKSEGKKKVSRGEKNLVKWRDVLENNYLAKNYRKGSKIANRLKIRIEKDTEKITAENQIEDVELAKWIFIELHRKVEDLKDPNILKAMELINHCLKNKKIFPCSRLKELTIKLASEKKTHVILLKTLTQIYLIYPEAKDWLISILKRMLENKPWRHSFIWGSYIKCLAWTLPASIELLISFESKILKNALDKEETLRQRLKELYKQNPLNLRGFSKENLQLCLHGRKRTKRANNEQNLRYRYKTK